MDESPEVKLAVAVTEIAWIKDTLGETRDTVKDLSSYIKSQDERVARKDDLEKVEVRVRKLENWRNVITGAYIIAAGAIMLIFEYGKQWFGLKP